ncbi:MAG: pyrimidine dimer DNA glycosylase/endonuclease V [candidate division WOR-3 bacterium]
MRLWSLDPSYLDGKGLVVVWREGLLAKNVLAGKTMGFKTHPQLIRFRNHKYPVAAINAYLTFVYYEARRRNYNFDKNKICLTTKKLMISVTTGQLVYEFKHLTKKLMTRSPEYYRIIKKTKLNRIKAHPIFRIIKGDIEFWEKY